MATPNIVPRADSEGGLGTASKYWAAAYIDAITTTGNINLPDDDFIFIGYQYKIRADVWVFNAKALLFQ